MFLNRSKFDLFIFTVILCVGVYSITVEQDCAACICEGVLKTVANSNADYDMAHTKSKKVVCAGDKDLVDQEHLRIVSSMSLIIIIINEEQVWKPVFHQQQFGAS